MTDDIKTERSVIAYLLRVDPSRIVALHDEYFDNPQHRAIAAAIRECVAAGELDGVRVDTFRVASRSGVGYPQLMEIYTDDVNHYAEFLLRENWIERKLKRCIPTAMKQPNGLDMLHALKAEIAGIEESVNGSATAQGPTSVQQFGVSLDESPVLYRTGIESIDANVGGFEPGELVIIAGRPGMGKTALGCTLALNMARARHSVTFHSYEMLGRNIVRRLVARVTNENSWPCSVSRIRKRALTEEQLAQCHKAAQYIEVLPLRIESSAGKDIAVLCDDIRRSESDIHIIDHLTHIPFGREANRYTARSGVSNALQAVSKRTGKTVILLVQLNRGAAEGNATPALHHLRESGELEQDAETVILVHDPNYAETLAQNVQDVTMEMIVAKCRDGSVGTAPAIFSKPFSVFFDIPANQHRPELF